MCIRLSIQEYRYHIRLPIQEFRYHFETTKTAPGIEIFRATNPLVERLYRYISTFPRIPWDVCAVDPSTWRALSEDAETDPHFKRPILLKATHTFESDPYFSFPHTCRNSAYFPSYHVCAIDPSTGSATSNGLASGDSMHSLTSWNASSLDSSGPSIINSS